MRIFVITLIVLIAVITAGLAVAPRLVDWNDYRGLLTRQAEAITGGAVSIQGRISLSLLPTPTLTLAQTKFAGGAGPGGRAQLAVDRIDLRLRALPLLRGDIQIGDIRLVRPVLQLEKAPTDDAAPRDDEGSLLSLAAIRPDRLTVIDGRAALRDDRAWRWQIESIDVEVIAQSPDGPFGLTGGFAAANRTFDLDARIGRLSPDRVGTLQLTFAALGPHPASLRYNGAVWWHPNNPRVRGDVTLAGQDLGSVAAMVGGAFSQGMPALPLHDPFEVAGRLQLDHDGLRLDDLRLLLAEARAVGHLSLGFVARPTLMLALQIDRLELDELLAARPTALAPVLALARSLRGEVDLSVAALPYRDRTVDRARLRLELTGDGVVTVEQASAILPGQTDLRFAGRVAAVGERVDLRGKVAAVTDDLGSLLGWLDLRPTGVATGRLRTLSISSAIAIEGDAVRLSETEVRLDASQLRGEAALEAGAATDGTGHRFTADLVVDRINLDAYGAGLGLLPSDAARLLQAALRDANAEIAARIDRLTWRGLLLHDVMLALRAADGRLEVSNASLGMGREAQARLDGQVDLESGTFAWSGEFHTTRVARLLRRLGLPAPLMLARAPPLTLSASAAGRPGHFDLEAEIDDGVGRLAATGEVGWVDGDLRYDLELEVDHSDLDSLIRPLGARIALDGDAAPTALSFAGRLTGAAEQHTIAGSARLGAMSLTGLLSAQPGLPRPRYDLQLSVAEPTFHVLAASLALMGLHPGALLLDAPLLGNWPQQQLDLGPLSRFDASVRLSAKGGLAREGAELDVRLQDGTLYVDRASLRLDEGTLSAVLTLEADRPMPFLTASLDLREVEAPWLTERLDLDPVLEGRMNLHAEVTAAGSSAYDLVRALIGDVELTMGAGRLVGDQIAPIRAALRAGENDHALPSPKPADEPAELQFSDLLARFALERGIASIESVELHVDDAGITVAGVIDLLLWAADLTVEVAAPDHPDEPIALRIVGPLDRPQTRLNVPPALRAETVAP